MRLPRHWIGIDVLGTRFRGEIIVHSVAGQKVGRRFGRVAKAWCDFEGERLIAGIIHDAVNGHDYTDRAATDHGIECRLHWVLAPDGVPVGLNVWTAPGPVPPAPIMNSWIMDLQSVTTRSGGDDLTLIGDGRQPGEERPIRELLQWLVPDDAREFLSMYYNALTADAPRLIDAFWSVKPAGRQEWVHFWSAAAVDGELPPRRYMYGLTVQLVEREPFDPVLSKLIRFNNSTLLMVDARIRVVLTSTGPHARDFGEAELDEILGQHDLAEVLDAPADKVFEQQIQVGTRTFRSAAFLVTASAQDRHRSPVAILLEPLPDH
ncbi:hypothetical protein NONO_c26430 [Nocardia nova SH22a]|uniref:Rv3651-like N-terminal domain-containing protein n=1 Tax=Nocardia nova SH22a TaxID=1415166 RepID=W5TDN5_9NOCA|nr:hypothetical protein NONO_c26430 [Nocardia nova SH22a]